MELEIQEINQAVFSSYESALQSHRVQFKDFLKLFFAEKNPKVLLLFWINFSYLGVGMTEPVEHWIRRAGENCKKLGYDELGIQLCKHAIHEADHHLMMIEDGKNLISVWNKENEPKLEMDSLLQKPLRNCVKAYQDLHEFHINGTTPYCQIAIEYEIENLSVAYGKQILNHSAEILGEDFIHFLSFVDDHVRIDAAHTLYNKKAITNFLVAYPQFLNDLISTGIKSLEIYGAFLAECFDLAAKNRVD